VSLTELFESHEQTVPASKLEFNTKYQQTSLHRFSSPAASSPSPLRGPRGRWVPRGTATDSDPPSSPIPVQRSRKPGLDEEEEDSALKPAQRNKEAPRHDLSGSLSSFAKNAPLPFKPPTMVGGWPSFGHSTTTDEDEDSQEGSKGQLEPYSPMREIPAVKLPSNSQPSPSRSARRRLDAPATITIGDRAPVTTGGPPGESPWKKRKVEVPGNKTDSQKSNEFTGALGKFMAPGTQAAASLDDDRRKCSLEEDVEDSEEDLPSDCSEGNYEQRASPVPGANLDQHGSLVDDVEPGPEMKPAEQRMDTDGRPLFGPNTETLEVSEEEYGLEQSGFKELEGVEDAEETPALVHEDGDEYLPEAEEQRQARVKARAARLLEQAEQHEVARPIEEILARSFRILSNSRKHSIFSTVRFEKTSLEQIKESAKCFRDVHSSNSPSTSRSDDLLDTQDETAEQHLTLTVSKEDFLKMDIHGQFNKGFIITTQGSELFIIDQHASDEKYNFETLQATTVVQNQPLVVPRPLDLMAMDEIAVVDNLDVLKKNGFVVDVDPEAPTGKRCKLVSLPMSKETIFGVEGSSPAFLTWPQADCR
jgi:DNA mismatch repair protein PMS2